MVRPSDYKLTPDGKFAVFPDGTHVRHYWPHGKTLRAFLSDRVSRVKVLQGPVGSGKSGACIWHIYLAAMAQPAQTDGKKRFRAHIIRESYSRIEETCLRSLLDWFPPGHGPGQFGRFYETRPYLYEIRQPGLELDIVLISLEDIREAKSYFMSLETSLIWFNEASFAQFAVIREAVARVSPPRFPAMKDGGCAWGGLILDTNAPPGDHWIPVMRQDVPPPDWMSTEERDALRKPANWTFYMQPPGLLEKFENGRLVGYEENPEAENLVYLPKGFYREKIAGQTKSWIDSNIMNRSAVVVDGRPVYPTFRRDLHVSETPLVPLSGLPVDVGLDFGRQPAALMAQHLRGRWFVQREYIGRDMSATEFAPALKGYLSQHYPGHSFNFWGDPSGGYRGQATDRTPFDVFRAHGMAVRPAPGKSTLRSLRQEAMNAVLLRLSREDGRPDLVVDSRCSTFITGMAGGYFMRRLQVSSERYAEEPEKNQWSHVVEAGEYMLLGGGEGRGVVMPGSEPKKPQNVLRPYNPFARQGRLRTTGVWR